MTDKQLTPNFKLSEFINSATAKKFMISEQYHPSPTVLDNIQLLANVLQTIRTAWGLPFSFNSGYRCKRVNDAVKGSKTSAHIEGLAVDISLKSKAENKRFFEFVKKMSEDKLIIFDQLINENDYSWVHFGIKDKPENCRKQILHLKQK